MPASVIPVTGLILGPVGSVSNTDFPITTPRLIESTDTYVPAFGDAVILNNDNTYSSVAQFITGNSGTLTNKALIGFAQANVKTNTYYPTAGGTSTIANSGTYPAGSIADVLTRGTINVAVNNGTPAGANAPVFIRIATSTTYPTGVVGGVEGAQEGTIAGAVVAGNTGNGTIGTLSLSTYAQIGAYAVRFIAATQFVVSDPNGNLVGFGKTGTAFTSDQVNFTITAGATAFVAGDGFTVTPTLKTLALKNGIVFKTGILSTDPASGQIIAQVTIKERLIP